MKNYIKIHLIFFTTSECMIIIKSDQKINENLLTKLLLKYTTLQNTIYTATNRNKKIIDYNKSLFKRPQII